MKLIVNTNRIIAALIKDGISREIILKKNIDLIFIETAGKKIKKYEEIICKKAGITKEVYQKIITVLREKMTLLPDEILKLYIREAKEIIENIDPDDIPFIAAALAIDADIWSDDQQFNQQKRIKTWTTKELYNILE